MEIELNVGQLVMARGFTLHDTMTAIEVSVQLGSDFNLIREI